jgi:hypothetical protein
MNATVAQILGEDSTNTRELRQTAQELYDAVQRGDLATALESAAVMLRTYGYTVHEPDWMESLGEAGTEDRKLKPVPKGPFNKRQLKMGSKEEREHTTDAATAQRIAKQHLAQQGAPEKQNYYSLLKKHIEPKMPKTKAFLMTLPSSSSAPSSP